MSERLKGALEVRPMAPLHAVDAGPGGGDEPRSFHQWGEFFGYMLRDALPKGGVGAFRGQRRKKQPVHEVVEQYARTHSPFREMPALFTRDDVPRAVYEAAARAAYSIPLSDNAAADARARAAAAAPQPQPESQPAPESAPVVEDEQ